MYNYFVLQCTFNLIRTTVADNNRKTNLRKIKDVNTFLRIQLRQIYNEYRPG